MIHPTHSRSRGICGLTGTGPAMGWPHFGHAAASVEISVPHSGQGWSAIGPLRVGAESIALASGQVSEWCLKVSGKTEKRTFEQFERVDSEAAQHLEGQWIPDVMHNS